jgi:transposase-like protein
MVKRFHTAEILGRNRVTLHKWIRQYRFGGIEGLLKQNTRREDQE